MWLYSKYLLAFYLATLVLTNTTGQNCDIRISGFIKDLNTGVPISQATIYAKELQKGAVSNQLGYFTITSVCPGDHHLTFGHIGCEAVNLYLTISKDTTITVLLDHSSQLLNEVAIISKSDKVGTQETHSLNSESIAQNSDKNLGTMLENISGVSTIKNGSGISKPVVHGLYGNRLNILNNGVAQSGQQWGIDHSPEIDPLVANRITVIKGVGVAEYLGGSLGSIVLVEPERIKPEPHLHGETRYFFETNGLGSGLNLSLQQHGKIGAWRLVGTLKKSGDRKTPQYFLRNTGSQEANLALQLEKTWNKKWFSDLYLSSFNTEVGVLRGSHIGNLTDLEAALERDIPFFTEDDFSYSIGSPRQKVNHQLLKFHTQYRLTDKQQINFTYAGQYNLRKEFDVRRSGRSELPALSLEQLTHFIEAKYQNYLPKNWELKTGVQANRVDNINLPETGILPLIPDYISYKYGLFAIVSKRLKKVSYQFGGRYDAETRNVAAISTSLPREVVRYQNNYANVSALGGLSYQLAKKWKASYNIGYAIRNPEVNELYSNGLHQGVGGIEEGNPNLTSETSLKNTLSVKGMVKKKLFIEALVYVQQIADYIFINPQDEFRLTIRGAFPVFKYEQTDALLAGFDLAATYQITDQFNMVGKYSFLDGKDQKKKTGLVYMPSNNLHGALNYQIPQFGKFQKMEFQINNKYVFEQKNVTPAQDFTTAPAGYYLLGIKVSAERQLKKLRVNLFLRAENVLNKTYRDYLNRQRYFADDLGFNLVAGVNVSF